MLGVGHQIGNYEVVRSIGSGGQATVYLCRHRQLDRLDAVKVLPVHVAEHSEAARAFGQEARIAAQLRHQHIVPIYDAGEANGLFYIAMRHVEGQNLDTFSGGLRPDESQRLLRVLEQVSGALDAAHQQHLVHRDVKPANVLVEAVGTSDEHAVLLDFGIAKLLDTARQGMEATGFAGTLAYAAPERLAGSSGDSRSDQYSLACTIYRCLVGEVPFKQDMALPLMLAHADQPVPRASERRRDLPVEVDAVFARGMAKQPAERFPNCRSLVDALADALRLQVPHTVTTPVSGPPHWAPTTGSFGAPVSAQTNVSYPQSQPGQPPAAAPQSGVPVSPGMPPVSPGQPVGPGRPPATGYQTAPAYPPGQRVGPPGYGAPPVSGPPVRQWVQPYQPMVIPVVQQPIVQYAPAFAPRPLVPVQPDRRRNSHAFIGLLLAVGVGVGVGYPLLSTTSGVTPAEKESFTPYLILVVLGLLSRWLAVRRRGGVWPFAVLAAGLPLAALATAHPRSLVGMPLAPLAPAVGLPTGTAALDAPRIAVLGLLLGLVVIAIFGWIRWSNGGPAGLGVALGVMPRTARIVLGASGVAFTALVYLLMRTAHGPMLLQAVALSFALLGGYAVAEKYVEGWMLLIVSDLCGLGITVSRPFVGPLANVRFYYLVSLALAIWGLASWWTEYSRGRYGRVWPGKPSAQP